MQHRRIQIVFTDGSDMEVVIDKVNGVRIEDGVARFGRTGSTRWTELIAAPLVNIKYWHWN